MADEKLTVNLDRTSEVFGDEAIRVLWQLHMTPKMGARALQKVCRRANGRVQAAVDQDVREFKIELHEALDEALLNDPPAEQAPMVEALRDVFDPASEVERIKKFDKLRQALQVRSRDFAPVQRLFRAASDAGETLPFDEFLDLLPAGLEAGASRESDPGSREALSGLVPWISQAAERWRARLAPLQPGLVESVHKVSEEYLAWLTAHPRALDRIAWQAFEELVAEIMASEGFQVDITARCRSRSADIIAIRTDAFGVETKYLIECKRYVGSNRIGLETVNAVLGAKTRARADHAMLVTTSSFTRDVEKLRAEFRELRLHLRDGARVREWLGAYEPREDGGLWLPRGWDAPQGK